MLGLILKSGRVCPYWNVGIYENKYGILYIDILTYISAVSNQFELEKTWKTEYFE